MRTTHTTTISAREVRKGAMLVGAGGVRLRVLAVRHRQDGSIQIYTAHSDQRMTASVPVRVAH